MKHHEERRAKAADILSQQGYGKMKDIADHEVAKAVGEHDKQMHGGKKTHLKLKDGGKAMGKEPMHRLDRKPRSAGGRNKSHKEPKVSVNVINAGGKQPMPVPMAGSMAPHPPMPMPAPQVPAGPPPGVMASGAPPMSARPMMPPPGGMPQRPFKGGGPVRDKGNDIPHLEGGSGGGLGRLEKAAHEKTRRKAI